MGDAPTLTNSDHILAGLRLGGVGVWRWKIDTEQLRWTENLEAVHSLPAGTYDGTLSSFKCDLHPDDVEPVWLAITKSILTEVPYNVVYRSAKQKGEKWIEAAGAVVLGDDGQKYLTGVCFDVTSRVQAERELKRRLHQQQLIAQFILSWRAASIKDPRSSCRDCGKGIRRSADKNSRVFRYSRLSHRKGWCWVARGLDK